MKRFMSHISSIRARLILLLVLALIFLSGIGFGSMAQSNALIGAGLFLIGIGGFAIIMAASYLIIKQVQSLNKISANAHAAELERDRLQVILSCMGEGLIAIDADYRVIMCNDRTSAFLRTPPIETIGKEIQEVFPIFRAGEPGRICTKKILAQTIQDINIITIKLADKFLCKNSIGQTFPVAIVAETLLKDTDIIGSVILFRDISEEKEVDQAKDEFVSLASHQLRTPLSTINWYTEMILEGDAGHISKKQKSFLHEINTANKRMTTLVSSLLNVSRIELGTFAIDPKPTDVIVLIREVLGMLKPEMDKHEIKLQEQYGEIPIMDVDPQLMQIVFQNLISNAIKYSPKGSVVGIEISCKKQLKNGAKRAQKQLVIRIRDTGYGIPKNQQSKIFTKLFRADNIKSKITDGNGLGLYIVKSIISHSGGTISFESEENKGTSFCITLPVSGMRQKIGAKKLGG